MLLSDKLKFYKLKASRKSLALSLRNTGYMIKVGMATFIAELSMGIMMVAGNYMFLSYLGEPGVAAFSVGCYLFPLIFSISNAVAQASQPIISYNYGAGSFDRVREALKIALVTAFACGVLISASMWVGSPALTMIFLNPSETAYELAVKGLPLLGLCTLFFAINITFIGYYQSREQSLRSIIYMLLRGVVFMVPGFVVLPKIFGSSGLWLAIPASELLTFVVILAIYFLDKARRSCL